MNTQTQNESKEISIYISGTNIYKILHKMKFLKFFVKLNVHVLDKNGTILYPSYGGISNK